ncbi:MULTISPECIES: DUF3945 domain-containing protein [Bacteroidales]|uniref:DUF3945 domain-containing protein n=1 Tax=Bacteroidales TaxID=171549 RepID=UPI00359F5555
MDEKLNPKDRVLLMRNEGEGNRLQVVKGIDKKGKIDAIDPMKAKPGDFLIIDKHADPIENFFKNFFNQAKNPSHTGFYAVTADMLDKVLTLSEKELEKFRINPKNFLNQTQGESQSATKQKEIINSQAEEMKPNEPKTDEPKTDFRQFDTNRIPDSEYQKYGITPENLKDELHAMSYGYKSPHLLDITPNIDGVEYPMKARLSLEEQPDGSLKFVPHPYQHQVDLEKPFQGVILPDDVKENLLATGNGGRVVELTPNSSGEKVPSLVSVDKLTNRLEAVPVDKLTVSQNLKGIELTPEQQQALKAGQKVLVEGMTSRNTIGTDNPVKFDAYVQFNAAKGGYDFTYDGLNRNRYRQDKADRQEQSASSEQSNHVRIPKNLLGVDLDKKQRDSLREGKTVYVQGMVKDGQGEPFNAYVKVNNEKGKLDFFKWNPDKARKQGAKVKPAEESKTQVAVNSHGKTNEATKHTQERLKQGQQRPTEAQDNRQKQQQTVKNLVRKSAGQRM